jgi:tetratricopeptide (TPR) repeat protein
MYRAAQQDTVRRRVALFLAAADEALRRDDLVTAAQQYRLALQNSDDPVVRAKLDAIEEASRERVHARHVSRAQSAEKSERWAEAGTYYALAHEVRPEPSTADRAARAILNARGDLKRAAELADQAVRAAPECATYRVTLGEICLASGQPQRAVTEAERALSLAPGHLRAQALAEIAAKKA